MKVVTLFKITKLLNLTKHVFRVRICQRWKRKCTWKWLCESSVSGKSGEEWVGLAGSFTDERGSAAMHTAVDWHMKPLSLFLEFLSFITHSLNCSEYGRDGNHIYYTYTYIYRYHTSVYISIWEDKTLFFVVMRHLWLS